MAIFTTTANGVSAFDLEITWANYTSSISGQTVTWTRTTGNSGPARVELTYSGLQTVVNDEPRPHEPTTFYTAGTLTGFRRFENGGDLNPSVTVTGLTVDAIYFNSLVHAGLGNLASKLLTTAASNTINGSAGSDSFVTFSGGDRVVAGAGNDLIYDMGGRDRYEGGEGFDTVSYEMHWLDPNASGRGVTVDLLQNKVTAGGQIDTLDSIERVVGSHLGDTFRGSNGNDVFIGLGGRDNIRGGRGEDTVDYSRDAEGPFGGFRGISADLGKSIVRDGFGYTDSVRDVENVIGTTKRDTIIGSKADNRLEGRAGNDIINGGAGNDLLIGGSGADVFVFNATVVRGVAQSFGTDTIADFANGIDRIDLRAFRTDGFDDLTITAEGTTAVVRIDGVAGTIRLENVVTADLDATDFIF